MKKLTLLGFICLAVMLTALPFMACAEPTPPAPPAGPTVITPTPAVVTPSPTPPVTPAPVAPAPTPVTPVGPAAPVTPAPAPVVVTAPAGEPVYTVMDPRSWQPPVEYQGISPRLDTLDGKKVIVVNNSGGNSDLVMPSLATDLQAAVPGCNVTYLLTTEKRSVSKAEWELIESQDAMILGHDF